ncbi:cytochrome c [Schlegelella sp. ID0723]|uniref:Cytochrome c n=2 Tax=Piscinibacter koreensis TaxID=2742824 RepID=A0A7Y6NJX6_9BURK|nr:cytochrome c [Schlegelella koreensis]NUZ04479.1 cytochrome c [Schlegelella koreensis]
MTRGWGRTLAAIALVAIVLVAALAFLNRLDESAVGANAAAPPSDAASVERGRYLAAAGNCVSCHTVSGGAPLAGGRAIETPFGAVYAPNLTPDPDSGLGRWSAGEFWRAMHNGRSRDGRLLYPAFPYPNYTRVTRADSDAIYAYLMSLPPTRSATPTNELRFPFNLQASLAVWRALYFRPGTFSADTTKSAEWNRGAYLVEGLAHCGACHAPRNALGATRRSVGLAGGLIPVQNWYAPSLTSNAEAGVGDWSIAEIVNLLQHGLSARGIVTGPMAEVVQNSTQYLGSADLGAVATYLKSIAPAAPAPQGAASAGPVNPRGAQLYAQHCEECHGTDGRGVPNAYPPLAGNRAVTMDPPANLVHIVLQGGYAPATAGNPRPFGMPPYAGVLSDDDIADLLTHLRGAWGNRGGTVSTLDVRRYRTGS